MKYKPGSTVEWNYIPQKRKNPSFFSIFSIFGIGCFLGIFLINVFTKETPKPLPLYEKPTEEFLLRESQESQEIAKQMNIAQMNAAPNLSSIEKAIEKKREKKKSAVQTNKKESIKQKPVSQDISAIPLGERPYTQFEIAMYYLKSHESFRPHEYDDGTYPSKGFGLNLSPEHVNWATDVLGFPARSRDWSYAEGQKLLRAFWSEKRERFIANNSHLTPNQQTAILLHSYNTGKYKNIQGCCGSKRGCGRRGSGKNANIRKSHNSRRDFEWRLYNNQVTHEEITNIRKQAIKVDATWKN